MGIVIDKFTDIFSSLCFDIGKIYCLLLPEAFDKFTNLHTNICLICKKGLDFLQNYLEVQCIYSRYVLHYSLFVHRLVENHNVRVYRCKNITFDKHFYPTKYFLS